jgi:hypothetical protein
MVICKADNRGRIYGRESEKREEVLLGELFIQSMILLGLVFLRLLEV